MNRRLTANGIDTSYACKHAVGSSLQPRKHVLRILLICRLAQNISIQNNDRVAPNDDGIPLLAFDAAKDGKRFAHRKLLHRLFRSP
ncbi:hypothetical protein D1872_268710 [compost metagenome]